MARFTYFRGTNELLAKGFIFRSHSADVYFVNVRFFFNEERMVLVQSYRYKGRRSAQALQSELHLETPEEKTRFAL